jgi:hypothetical protein
MSPAAAFLALIGLAPEGPPMPRGCPCCLKSNRSNE